MIRHRLANGMEFVFCPSEGAHVVSIQCIVWAGSLDERSHERGVAHFLEHMLFKGTTNRGVGEIASMVEGAGGDINAYTTFDKTVFYLTLPTIQADLGFDVLSDAIFRSSFEDGEFQKEREVILEEIRRGNDDPGGQVGRKIFSELYKGSEAGRPIIGFADEVKNFSRQILVEFWKKWYQPQNMSLVVVGHMNEAEAVDLAEKYFGRFKSESNQGLAWGSGRHRGIRREKSATVRAVVIAGEYEQARLDIVLGAPALDAPDCAIIDTASYVLGGSDVSRLQRRLKENEAIVNAIGASAYTPTFDGVFEVSAACEAANFSAACKSIARELVLLVEHEPASQLEVDRARAASRIGRIHREETVDGIARAIVSGLATPMKEKFEQVYDQVLNSFSPSEMSTTLRREWDLDSALIVVLCDKEHAPEEEKLVKAFNDGLLDARRANTAVKTMKRSSAKTASIHRFEVGQGVPVIYRQIPGARMFSASAATEGGQRGEDIETAGTFHAVATLLGLATKRKSYDEFSGRLEDMGTILGGFSGKDSLGFEMHCIDEQVEEMIGHLAEAMMLPDFPVNQWESYRRETLESLKLQQDSASWICMRRLHQKIYGPHPYAMPITGIEKTVREFSAEALLKFYEAWRDGGSWVFAIAGGAPADLVESIFSKKFSSFKNQKKNRDLAHVLSGEPSLLGIPARPRRTQEQAHLSIAGLGPKWGDKGREAVDILVNILGGHGGRLFTTLRDQESLAYSVSPLHSNGVLGGIVGAYIATAVDKASRAMSGLERELRKISSNGPTTDEIQRAKSYILGSHEIGLQRTSSQAMTMALMELYGMGWDDFLHYPERIRHVGVEEIKDAAKKYFDPSRMESVIVGAE